MTVPGKDDVIEIAQKYGYFERKGEKSRTLFFEQQEYHAEDPKYPNLINVFYTTQGVMTKIKHPRGGYNQLWRSDAYDSCRTLSAIFRNPRIHTGRGYRTADDAIRGCAACGLEKKRSQYSNNQWRKGSDVSKCKLCVEETLQAQQENSPYVDAHFDSKAGATRWDFLMDCITCDANGCKNKPTIRCSRCEMAYYCSEVCQRRHRAEHSNDLCRFSVDEMRMMDDKSEAGQGSADTRGWAIATQLSGKSTFKALLAQAKYIHIADEEWRLALGLYRVLVMREQEEGTPAEWRQVWMGFSRCFYELKDYERAIHSGRAALQMNRMFPQVHKYIALSQRDSGDLPAAIQTMKEAVLFEAPYDDENKQLNVDLLWEMLGN